MIIVPRNKIGNPTLELYIFKYNEYVNTYHKLQDMDDHKNKEFIVTESGKNLLFQEWELIVDDEDDEVIF